MNRYDRYKDSGIPWLGDVPEHWIIMPIKFSLSMPITDGPHETPEILSDGIPFISAEAVKNDKLDFNKKRGYISEEDNVRFSKKYSPKKGDIYMVKSGATTGNVAKVETDEVFNIWSPLAVMRPDKNRISTEFLFYAIKSDYFNTSVQLKWNMGTQQNIGMGILSNIRVVVPPTDEQTAIAHYLDTKLGEIDALIDKQQTLLEKLAEQRTAVITHAVTKGLNPTAPMKNSGVEWLGDVPAHWEVKRLKFSVRNISQKVESQTSDLRYFGLENIESFTGRLILNIELESEGIANKFQENDVLFGKLRPYLAKVHLATQNGLVSTETLVFRAKKAINPKFLFYFCVSKDFIDAVNGTTFGSKMPRANWEDIGNFKMLIPSLEEQAIIIDYLNQETAKIDRLCETVNQTIGRLKEYRTALITQAVTGKIKVTDE
ncbi:hypothetical protein HMPREF2753_07265 [Neisseria sp. HMSC071C03]|nr:hypothetical protein HMPREF3054_09410 [Neisseria sp. HMSC071B12]OHR45823.1 hypothetical protein HMPREF2753_07265 [Neisseria sp. HMSC071C03]